jgi:hypothetical protein
MERDNVPRQLPLWLLPTKMFGAILARTDGPRAMKIWMVEGARSSGHRLETARQPQPDYLRLQEALRVPNSMIHCLTS